MHYTHQKKTPLLTALSRAADNGNLSFDVPGHKKGALRTRFSDALDRQGLRLDMNSMPELDLLDHPRGVIKDAESLLANLYGADEAFFLVNGSTFGVQAMIFSACQPGAKILLPRNVHKSAINALILTGAVPVFLQPETDPRWGISHGITLDAVKEAVSENPDAAALLVVNPTYYGAASDLAAIVAYCHRRRIAVLVDEAHGAHLHFHEDLPASAMDCGADLSTMSLHKTCGSLTQSSALLVNEGLVDHQTVRGAINLMQTTSASYLLMASLDATRALLATEGQERLSRLLPQVAAARGRIAAVPGLEVLSAADVGRPGIFAYDGTKIAVKVNDLGISGYEAYRAMREKYGIQLELSEPHTVLAICSFADDAGTLARLAEAFEALSREYFGRRPPLEAWGSDPLGIVALPRPRLVVPPRDAFYAPSRIVPISEAEGEISGESLMAYPPGIPLVIPGERLTRDVIRQYEFILENKGTIINEQDNPRFVRILGA